MSGDVPLPGDPDFVGTVPTGPPLDLAGVDARLRQRARRRSLLQGGALALVLAVGVAAAPWSADGDGVRLAAAPQGQAATAADAPQLPAWLPPGYARCDAPRQAGEVRRTRMCGAGLPDLVLDQGPHWALPEVGDPIAVARRRGHLHRTSRSTVLVVSDGNHLEDGHHALRVADPAADAEVLARVLASIPAVQDAPPPR